MNTRRLDALVARFAPMSRQEAARVIRAGRVCADGAPCTKPDARFSLGARVALDGEWLDTREARHILMNKPVGLLTAASDPRAPTVMTLLPAWAASIGCMPVGRLDKDTSGALLFTTDGALAHRLLDPERGVYKVYLARVRGLLHDADARAFESGVALKDFTCRPARLEIVRADEDESLARVTVHEGRYHQVRRMLAARGHEVLSLHRERFGALSLGELSPGAWRELTPPELAALYEAASRREGETP